jgi:nucleoside 2-deoxyribosyltransferase
MTGARGKKRIYLAGPLGFSEGGNVFKETLTNTIANLGYEVIDPFKLTPESKFQEIDRLPTLERKQRAWKILNPQIARRGQQAIDNCDLVFAVLDGPDVDSGTAAEIGYAYARNKPILGYRGDFRLASDNSGAIINLQVEYFISESGGEIVVHTSSIPKALSRMFKRKQARPSKNRKR